MSDDLKPCPFCGQPPYARHARANPWAGCKTEGCWGAKLPIVSLDSPKDVEAWNTRAADAQLAAAEARAGRLSAAALEVIEFNRQHARDQYGDADKCENWSCVRTLRAALAERGESQAGKSNVLTDDMLRHAAGLAGNTNGGSNGRTRAE